MTPQQVTAYGDPCFEAKDTLKAKFGRRLLFPRDDITVRLTANIGLE